MTDRQFLIWTAGCGVFTLTAGLTEAYATPPHSGLSLTWEILGVITLFIWVVSFIAWCLEGMTS